MWASDEIRALALNVGFLAYALKTCKQDLIIVHTPNVAQAAVTISPHHQKSYEMISGSESSP